MEATLPMPAMHPDDDDRPATRRDLAQMREVIEANVRADIAELDATMDNGFATVEQGFDQVESAITKQTWVLAASQLLTSSATAAVIIRATT